MRGAIKQLPPCTIFTFTVPSVPASHFTITQLKIATNVCVLTQIEKRLSF